MQTPIEYISTKAWEFKRQAGEFVIKACPFCRDEGWHFYMSPEGPWFCHKCNEKGNLWQLKKHLGDIEETIRPAFQKPTYKIPTQDQAGKYHHALLKYSGGVTYLESRGINQESIKRFKLGIYQNNGTKWLSIPHFQGKALKNIKFRSLPPAEKTFKRVKGCQSVLFNPDALKGQKEIYITEGELDTITLIQAGIENVVSGTTGAGSFDAEWIDQLKSIKKIYLCYDADAKGQQGARNLAKRLGYNRCFNIVFHDGQDANDYFNSGNDVFDFQKLVSEAHKFSLPGVVSADAAIDLL